MFVRLCVSPLQLLLSEEKGEENDWLSLFFGKGIGVVCCGDHVLCQAHE